jgi:hypothetical protein
LAPIDHPLLFDDMRKAYFVTLLAAALPCVLSAQAPATAAAAAAAATALPPATRLEAFKPAAGSVVNFAFTEVGEVQGVQVDAREMRGASGTVVRGLVVQVTQSQYREERSFVDVDEIPELLKGIDHLLSVKENPNPAFKSFEVRYTTKGELRVTAFSTSNGNISYAIEAGRVVKAQRFVDEGDLRKFRELLVSAQVILAPQATGAAK